MAQRLEPVLTESVLKGRAAGLVLVTGASGFIAAALTPALRARGVKVRAATRRDDRGGAFAVGEIGPNTDWSAALEGVSCVVHLAGLAHANHGRADLMRVNAEGADALAAQAEAAGVQRFIYVSSIKAVGEESGEGALDESVDPDPQTAYGQSKRAGEQAVLAYARINPVVLRPPLVHGPRAKANLSALIALADTPLPLPFARIANRRSLISLKSMVSAIQSVIEAEHAPSGIYHLADGPPLSTGEMVAALRNGLGRQPRLYAAPRSMLKLAPRMLTENLAVNDAAFRATYGYGPMSSADSREALRRTARAWKTMR